MHNNLNEAPSFPVRTSKTAMAWRGVKRWKDSPMKDSVGLPTPSTPNARATGA